MIALHAANRGVDDVKPCPSQLKDTIADAFDGLATRFGIAHNPSFTNIMTPGFELGLDQYDGGSLPHACIAT
jgi:hypothetical protein